MQLVIDVVDLLLPVSVALSLLFFKVGDLLLQLGDHLGCHYWLGLSCFLFFFVLSQLGLHLLDFSLFDDVLFVVFSKNPLILH